jgi:hypothetical protein
MKNFFIFVIFLWLIILTVRMNKNNKATKQTLTNIQQTADTQKARIDTLIIEHNRVVIFLDDKFGN